jgi:hypothetical protein
MFACSAKSLAPPGKAAAGAKKMWVVVRSSDWQLVKPVNRRTQGGARDLPNPRHVWRLESFGPARARADVYF